MIKHILIVGCTQSGKTTWIKNYVNSTKNQNPKIIIFDPTYGINEGDFENPNVKLYRDEIEFLTDAKNARNTIIIADECGMLKRVCQKSVEELGTLGRHHGNQVIFSGQRAIQIPRTARDQTYILIAFRVAPDDAKILSSDYICEELRNLPHHKNGECIIVSRDTSKKPRKVNIFK